MLRILTFLFCITAGAALADQGSDKKLETSLAAMGYENIVLEGCEVRYSQNFVPTRETNGFSSLTHILKINHFARREDVQIRRFKSGAGYFYILTIPVKPEYRGLYNQVINFRLWASDKYPHTNWPNLNPTDFDTSYQELEAELREVVPTLEQLTRKVLNTNFGQSTILHLRPQLESRDEVTLKALLENLYRFGAENGCK